MVYDTPWVQRPDEVEATAESDTPLPVARPPLGNRDFFVGKSLKDIGVFAGGFPEDEDLDELLAELDQLRGS
jgi:hypothetical protein